MHLQSSNWVKLRSKAEASRYGELKRKLMDGEIRELDVHPEYPVSINGERVCIYRASFRYFPKGSYKAIIEDVTGASLEKKLAEAYYKMNVQ